MRDMSTIFCVLIVLAIVALAAQAKATFHHRELKYSGYGYGGGYGKGYGKGYGYHKKHLLHRSYHKNTNYYTTKACHGKHCYPVYHEVNHHILKDHIYVPGKHYSYYGKYYGKSYGKGY